MSHDDKIFAAERMEEGFEVSDGGNFLTGPAEPATIHGEACLVRQCYSYENYRWEGFVSIAKSTPALDSFFLQVAEA